MNTANIKALEKFQKNFINGTKVSVLDVGSACVNGDVTGRSLWKNAEYHGVDLEWFDNVDEVVPAGWFDLGRKFDVVTSMSALEHTEDPFEAFENFKRHLKPGGFLFACAPFQFHYHRYPKDCWRLTPDSFMFLCHRSGLQLVRSEFETVRFWQERSWEWKFWNLWSLLYKQCQQIECYCVAQLV